MERQEQVREVDEQLTDFFEENPEIKDALRLFDIAYDQYEKALESGYSFYTDTSTSPPKMKYRSRSEWQ